MRIDLHTHSLASDGTDSPGDLVRAAKRAGLDVVALTDHDTTDGWAEAGTVADEVGIRLIPGMELSTKHNGLSMHLLAYHPDQEHPELAATVQQVLQGRTDRMPMMVERLRQAGIDITVPDVERQAGSTSATGRPHVADALVELGVVAHRNDAFERFLSRGGPGYVERYAASTSEMIALVRAAGGVPVLAHAWGRHGPDAVTEADFADFVEAGLLGLEVDHQDHTPLMREQLRGIARNLDLIITGSSDHHGTGKKNHDLGVNTTHPDELARIDEYAGR